MKSIIVKVELTNVDQWDINWKDIKEAKQELKTIELELRTLITDHLGVYLDNITVEANLSQ